MARNKVCFANAIKNPLGSQLRAFRLAIKFPIGNALKHPLGAQASFRLRYTHKEYINKKYLTTFGNKYTHLVGARNTLRARNTNTSVCVKDYIII